MKKLKKKVTAFVIDRAKWLRARKDLPSHDSVLLDDNGSQCCLGMYLSACGVRSRDLLDRVEPDDIAANLPAETAWFWSAYTEREERVMTALIHSNDSAGFSARARETRVRTLFREVGIAVTFRGRGRPLRDAP